MLSCWNCAHKAELQPTASAGGTTTAYWGWVTIACDQKPRDGSGLTEAQQVSSKHQAARIVTWEVALPMVPVSGNQARDGTRVAPTSPGLLPQKNGTGRNRSHIVFTTELPFEERRLQSLTDRLRRKQDQKPWMPRRKDHIPGGLIRTEGVNSGGVLAGDTAGVVARPVIQHQDFIAGTQRLKSPSQAKPVIAGVQDGGDRRHCEHAMGTQLAGWSNSSP